jgi:sulfur carrier protein ThiS
MDITIRLHGLLRDKLPPETKGKTSLTLPGGATVKDVLSHFDIDRIVSIAVNDEIELEETHPLHDGDHVEIFRSGAGG